jgi:hypothetical protein
VEVKKEKNENELLVGANHRTRLLWSLSECKKEGPEALKLTTLTTKC